MRLVILHASAGQGHTQAAEAAREGFLACGVSEKEILLLDALDETPAWFRKLYTSLYYYSVKHAPRSWGRAYSLTDQACFYPHVVLPVRRKLNGWVGENLVRRMIQEKPAAILFTHFFAPEIVGRAKRGNRLSSLLITVATDFIPHRFWANPGTDHYWVMSEEGKQNLEERRVPPDKIIVGGIPVSLRFRLQGRKKEFRKKEGLDEERFTLLITSGSFGLGPTAEVLRALREFGHSIQVIVVCGRNQALRQNLEKESYPFQIKLYGYVSHMDELMEASDLLIAKPGGATTAESFAKGIPMVVLQPIPGQEAGNVMVLKERNASFFLGKPSDIQIILKGILDCPEVLEEKKKSIQRLARPDAAIDLARFVLGKIKR